MIVMVVVIVVVVVPLARRRVRMGPRMRMRVFDALVAVALPAERLIADYALTGHVYRLIGPARMHARRGYPLTTGTMNFLGRPN